MSIAEGDRIRFRPRPVPPLQISLFEWQLQNKILTLNAKTLNGYAAYYCHDVEGREVWRVSPVFPSMNECTNWQRDPGNQGKVMAAVVAVTAAIGFRV